MQVIELRNVVKFLAGKQVLHNVNLSVNAGEIYGFLGPNGAGKTTTMKCIMWFIEPEEWSISILGEKWLTQESKKSIGFMPENTYLYKYFTGEEFLLFNGRFFWLSSQELEKKVEYLLTRVWLEHAGKKYLREYSKGMLQRVWLAQSIINEPKILFLDEPMSGLDPLGRKMVKDLIIELREKGTTVFFNTHILADVESICDRISIIHKWNIIVSGKKVKDIKWSLEDFFIESIEKE